MSPRKVNKEQKRREVALACSDSLYDIGIKNITVAQVAKIAGIGKGTVYEYFENKEDIIFEIINIHIEEYHEQFLESVKNIQTTREKLFLFFKFVTDDCEENQKHFKGFKEYLSVVLAEDCENMMNFNGSCHTFFRDQLTKIIEEGIANEELQPFAKDFIPGLMVFEKGLALMKMTHLDFDAKSECEDFINKLFNLIEIKK